MKKVSKIWVSENFAWELKKQAAINKMKIIPFTDKLVNDDIDLNDFFKKQKKNVFPKIN